MHAHCPSVWQICNQAIDLALLILANNAEMELELRLISSGSSSLGLTDWEKQEAGRTVLCSPALRSGVILKVDLNDPSWIRHIVSVSVSLRENSL